MRIGYDLTPITAAPTGVGVYTAALLTHMLAAAQPGETFHGWASGLARRPPDILAGLTSHRHLPIPTRALYALWTALDHPQADRLLGRVDLFHATNYFLPPVARARRILSIYDLSFLVCPQFSSPKIVGPFSRRIRRFAAAADAILTCSHASKKDIVEHLGMPPEKITVAHGAPGPEFTPIERDTAKRRILERFELTTPFLLYSGTLEPRKNVAGLIRAYQKIRPKIPHRLVLIGARGWNTASLDEALHTAGDGVLCLGYVPDPADLAACYAAADLFVFPSFHEGFGLPVIEAMACGCPVLTAPRASLPEVGGDAAVYAPPEDIDAIAAAILALLQNPEERARRAALGLEQAARFTWSDAAARTLALYRSLL